MRKQLYFCEKITGFWLKWVLQISNSALNWLISEKVTHWFLTDTFCSAWWFSCSFWFYFLLFWSNLADVLNFELQIFVLCWFESFYIGISKICIFLLTLHTIYADMLIICCTFFSEAVFLFSIRFLVFWWFLTRLWNFVYRTFQLVELLLEFAARGGVLALAITWPVTWPTTEPI